MKKLPAVEDVLAEAAPGKRKGKFEVWLESQDKDVQRLFWDVMNKGYIERAMPFSRVLESFLRAVKQPKICGVTRCKHFVDRTLDNA